MACSVNLGLDYLVTGQAQKEVTHNEALSDLDCLCQLAFVARDLNVPPVSPVDGAVYLVGSAPVGDWSGYAGQVAMYYAGWRFKPPRKGWLAFSLSEKKFLHFNGTSWEFVAGTLLEASFLWTPGTLAQGAGVTSAVVPVVGAAFGDFVQVSGSYSLQGVLATAYVSALDSVVVRLQNATGASVALAQGTWRVRVSKSGV